jgi:antitoxin component of MazEF toxin-antitoxin module
MKTIEVAVTRIGNSRGIRLPAEVLRRYQVQDILLLEQRPDEIARRPKRARRGCPPGAPGCRAMHFRHTRRGSELAWPPNSPVKRSSLASNDSAGPAQAMRDVGQMPRIHRFPGGGTEFPDLFPLCVESRAAEMGAGKITSLTVDHRA